MPSIGLHVTRAGTVPTDSTCGYLSALMMLPSPVSHLLHWDFWFDDVEPPGDDFVDVSVGERLGSPR